MDRREFLKGLGVASAVGAASVGITTETLAKHHSVPAEVFEPHELPTSTDMPLTAQHETVIETGPVNVLHCSYQANFKLADNVFIGETVAINASGEVFPYKPGEIPVGQVVEIIHNPDGTKECVIAMHGLFGYTCD